MQDVHHKQCGMLKDNAEMHSSLKILSLIFYISWLFINLTMLPEDSVELSKHSIH